MAGWYSLWSFVIFFPIWNVWTQKNLATLVMSHIPDLTHENGAWAGNAKDLLI
jgi:hypothetical protein